MIDTKELRRLAQAATPGPWKVGQYLGSPRQFVIHMDVGDKGRGSDVAFTSANFGNDETIANARLIAAANPTTISELLDRLEAAEKERDAAELMSLALRAKVEAMERQEPVTAQQRFQRQQEMMAVWQPWQTTELRKGRPARTVDVLGLNVEYRELYALPGAQPAPSVPDWTAVETAARILNIDLIRQRNELRAKIEAMERQEPVMWANSSNINSSRINRERGGCGDQHTCSETQTTYHDTRLYALPGAQNVPSVPDGWIQRGMAELEAIRSRQDDDTLLDDRTLIERIGKAMLAAAPEAKP